MTYRAILFAFGAICQCLFEPLEMPPSNKVAGSVPGLGAFITVRNFFLANF